MGGIDAAVTYTCSYCVLSVTTQTAPTSAPLPEMCHAPQTDLCPPKQSPTAVVHLQYFSNIGQGRLVNKTWLGASGRNGAALLEEGEISAPGGPAPMSPSW